MPHEKSSLLSKMGKKISLSLSGGAKVTGDRYLLLKELRNAGIEENQLQILKDYDTVIILDDSESMLRLWNQACRALSTLAAVASEYDTDGIEIRFINSPMGKNHLKSERDVTRLFESVSPAGRTPIGACLEDATRGLLANIEKGKRHKKTNYLVITDGMATDDVEGTIVDIARRLDKAGAPLSQLGIQFIQIGTSKSARVFLESLDNDLKEKHSIRDMVDTERYSGGPVTGSRLTKLLLGGINRKIDKT